MVIHVVGIDPGLVDTGVVRMEFYPVDHLIRVNDAVVSKPKDHAVVVGDVLDLLEPAKVFIEGYRPRSNLQTDKKMVELVAAIKARTKGTVLNNTGVKQVVKQPLMELLGVWKFSTPTHHQDLRSAARIALLGMLKDDTLNGLLTDIVRAHLAGRTWDVRS